MTRVKIEPGVCGLNTKVEAEEDDDGGVIVRIYSACKSIQEMAKALGEEFDPYEICMTKPGKGPFYEYAQQEGSRIHAACPTISGIIKCVEAECRLALKKNASIEFID